MKKFLLTISMSLLPMVAFAAAITDVESLINVVGNLMNKIAPLIIGVAFLYFIWGVVKYVTAGADEEEQKAGRNMMIYGIIALFVMTSVWGLVSVLSGTFQLTNKEGPTNIPRAFEIPAAN